MNFIKLTCLLLSLSVLALTSCSSTGGGTTGSASSPYGSIYDSPTYKTIRMQQEMSRVTRSLIPF